MKPPFGKTSICISVFTIGGVAAPSWLLAQASQDDKVVFPDSTVERAGDIGVRAHTNHLILVSGKPGPTASSPSGSGETPGSLGCVYAIPGATSGSSGDCTIANSTPNTVGGSGVIAIVDAYDYPNALKDLTTFSSTFGLPLPCATSAGAPCFSFTVVYATKRGRKPSGNCSWNQEAALDIEWAHAMSPQASIVLVEAQSSGLSDLLTAVNKASGIVQKAETGQVSMSWGSSEFVLESLYDSHFDATGVAYFAASGDTGASTNWPSVSPNVVSAGGTTVNRDLNGNFTGESAWDSGCNTSCGGGGGPSLYEPRPPYQNVISAIVGAARGTPDFSFAANPSHGGVSVYDSVSCGGQAGWMVFGGTSVSTAALAGIVNLAHSKNGTNYGTGGNSYEEQLLLIYPNLGNAADFNDITLGSTGYSAGTGWDFATGVGSNRGLSGK